MVPKIDDNGSPVRRLYGKESGNDVFVVGTGTSLMGFDWGRLTGKRTIALNDAVRAIPEPSYHLFSDVNIWTRYRDLAISAATLVVCQKRARSEFLRWEKCSFKDRVYWFDLKSNAEVERDDCHLFVNRTVATAGIQLAWKLGARRIFLLGIDGYKIRLKEGETTREVYYYDGTAKSPNEKRTIVRDDGTHVTQDRHEFWVKQMRELEAFLHRKEKLFLGPWPESGVYNLSAQSNIDAWQKVSVDDVI